MNVSRFSTPPLDVVVNPVCSCVVVLALCDNVRAKRNNNQTVTVL